MGGQRTVEKSGWTNGLWKLPENNLLARFPAGLVAAAFCFSTKKPIFVGIDQITFTTFTQMITYFLIALTLCVSGWQGFAKDSAKTKT